MPEGDTIVRAKQRLQVLCGQPLTVTAPHPRGRVAGVDRLDGRVLDEVRSRGKHLMLIFGDLTLHSHLGMVGSWRLYPRTDKWDRERASAWVVLSGESQEAAQFRGPTLRLLRTALLRSDPQLAALGPDLLADDFDLGQALVRFRAADRTTGLGEALLDQRLVCGIGNIYKSESCFAARLSPWRPLAQVSDEQLTAVLAVAREQMLAAVRSGRARFAVYRHRGPCPRCGGPLRSRGQGDANRTSWWCPRCQP